MADNTLQGPRARKFHEGWMYHQPLNGKVWTKYWMVLRGRMLFIFSSEHTGSDEMKGTLSLGPETELTNLPSETKKKGFKFELATTSTNNERKINRFKFDKEVDRDLWKAYIVGISVGIVPSDLQLLPGQIKAVQEAMAEVRNCPPPLPNSTIPRPRLAPQNPPQHSVDRWNSPAGSGGNSVDRWNSPTGSGGNSVDRWNSPAGGRGNWNDDDNASDDSGSFTSHMTRHKKRSESVPTVISQGSIQNLRQLMHRQHDLASQEVNSVLDSSNHSEKFPFSSAFKMPDLISQVAPSAAVITVKPKRPIPAPPNAINSIASVHEERHNGFNPPVHNGYTSATNNNNQTHIFYHDMTRNQETPSWFFEIGDDSRQVAEQILTMGHRFGNVLMRTSRSFERSGKYVISMRREVAGGTKLDHYEIIKTPQGFKINVDNKHSPMQSLSEVMTFFVSVAGTGTIPMKTNDLSVLFGSSREIDREIPGHGGATRQEPLSLRNANNHQDMHLANGWEMVSHYLQELDSNWILSKKPNISCSRDQSSSSTAVSPSSSRGHPVEGWSTLNSQLNGTHLKVSGSVPSGMSTMVREINTDFRSGQGFNDHSSTLLSQRRMSESTVRSNNFTDGQFTGHVVNVNHLNQDFNQMTVTEGDHSSTLLSQRRMSESAVRSNNFTDGQFTGRTNNMNHVYQDFNPMTIAEAPPTPPPSNVPTSPASFSIGGPTSPPPPPIGGPTSAPPPPPPLGGPTPTPPPPPPLGGPTPTPPPPPVGGPTPPAPPPPGGSVPTASPQQQETGFRRPRGSIPQMNPFGNRIEDLQSQLLDKLAKRKEEIYATATILKSNYD